MTDGSNIDDVKIDDAEPRGRWRRLGEAAESAREPSRDATGRVRAAQRRFDSSLIALRRAALDHVDRQGGVSRAARAALDHMRMADLQRAKAVGL